MSEVGAVAVKDPEQRLARPLRVLVPLIKEDLQHGREAAEKAGMPHYQAAGEKLGEAKSQMKHGEWGPWLDLNFAISRSQAARYILYAGAVAETKFTARGEFASLRSVERSVNPNVGTGKTAWHGQVTQIVSRVDTETLNLKREELKRQEERDAQRKLALQLIDIGYKVLARTLHPDKGGSREAMSRLNAVRERLKQSA